jgi:FAD/FMN-containing dehydrogenase
MRFNLIRKRESFLKIFKRSLAKVIEKRNPKYSVLQDNDLQFFESILGLNHCVTDSLALQSYNTDWLKIYKGASKLCLLPKSTEELAQIMKYCNERRLAVCPQGGNTGLVGGSVPVYDEIIVSTRLMNKIYELNPDSFILSCQSGCVLQTLDEYAEKTAGLMMPLDLGAKGSCQIGGNVSTNAGGLRFLRYGSLKGNVLGLEVVLADGTILDLKKTLLKKDNTGLDLKQLFIGAEGTLGIVSGVSIFCPIRPKSVNLIFVACSQKSFQNVIDVYKVAKRELNEIMSAFEFMDSESMRSVQENLSLQNPFTNEISKKCEFYCLIETHGSIEEHDLDKIEKFYSKLSQLELCSDGIIAENKSQFNSLWSLRERLAEALVKDGYNFKYDISLPLNKMYDLVIAIRKRFQENNGFYKKCIGYGHLGDSNLHLNLTTPTYNEKTYNLLEPFIYEWTRQNNGSISAEHGLGLAKRNYIHYSKTQNSIELMQKFKSIMDPNSILNPYKTIPN